MYALNTPLVSTSIYPCGIRKHKKPEVTARALKIFNEMLLGGEPFNLYTIKDKILNGLGQYSTFNDLMDEYIKKMKSQKGKSYSQPTIIKYRNSQFRVNEYVKKKYKRNDIFLYELTMILLMALKHF